MRKKATFTTTLMAMAFGMLFAGSVVLAAPSVQGGTSAKQTLSRQQLESIYGLYFKHVYTGLFTKKNKLQIGNKHFGEYMAGVSGILSYNLPSAVKKHLKTTSRKWYAGYIFGKLSGIKTYIVKQKRQWWKFDFYNPAIIKWGYQNMIPMPNWTVNNVTYQAIYNRLYKRFFRLMTLTQLYLAQRDRYQKELLRYLLAVHKLSGSGVTYLNKRFAKLFPKQNPLKLYNLDYYALSPALAAGFWLRRHGDGTKKELWSGLQKVMNLYDGIWFKATLKKWQKKNKSAKTKVVVKTVTKTIIKKGKVIKKTKVVKKEVVIEKIVPKVVKAAPKAEKPKAPKPKADKPKAAKPKAVQPKVKKPSTSPAKK